MAKTDVSARYRRRVWCRLFLKRLHHHSGSQTEPPSFFKSSFSFQDSVCKENNNNNNNKKEKKKDFSSLRGPALNLAHLFPSVCAVGRPLCLCALHNLDVHCIIDAWNIPNCCWSCRSSLIYTRQTNLRSLLIASAHLSPSLPFISFPVASVVAEPVNNAHHAGYQVPNYTAGSHARLEVSA